MLNAICPIVSSHCEARIVSRCVLRGRHDRNLLALGAAIIRCEIMHFAEAVEIEWILNISEITWQCARFFDLYGATEVACLEAGIVLHQEHRAAAVAMVAEPLRRAGMMCQNGVRAR